MSWLGRRIAWGDILSGQSNGAALRGRRVEMHLGGGDVQKALVACQPEHGVDRRDAIAGGGSKGGA